MRASIHSHAESVDAEPSHPRPTGTPAARNSETGAMSPPPMSVLELGQCATHDSDLWHSTARATDDGEGGIRRHVRGGWYAGNRPAEKHGLEDFVKNARR